MIRLFIIGLLFLMPLSAHSQTPSPSPSILRQTQQNKTERQNTKSNEHQRKTNDSPISFNITGTVNTKGEINNIAKKTDYESLTNGLLVFFNFLLAIFTFGLYRSTEKLWKAGYNQMQITQESVDLARKELILTQRPILRVSTVIISRVVLHGEKPGLVAIGKPINIQFYISNVGGTPATITNIGCWRHNSASTTPLPMERPYEGKSGNISIMQILNPGESIPITFTSEPMNVDHQGVILGQYNVYVMGWIEYRDDLKINRRFNFCRKYDPVKGRFFPVADDDYENQY
jgi:hypothetical protein